MTNFESQNYEVNPADFTLPVIEISGNDAFRLVAAHLVFTPDGGDAFFASVSIVDHSDHNHIYWQTFCPFSSANFSGTVDWTLGIGLVNNATLLVDGVPTEIVTSSLPSDLWIHTNSSIFVTPAPNISILNPWRFYIDRMFSR